MKPNHLGRVEKYFFLKSKHHDLDKVSYSRISRGCTLISQLKDPMVGFVNE